MPMAPRRSASSLSQTIPPLTAVSLLSIRRPPTSPLFPYTTLFRSDFAHQDRIGDAGQPPRAKLKSTRAHEQRSEEHTSELQSRVDLVCRLLLEKKKCPAVAQLGGHGVERAHQQPKFVMSLFRELII